MEPKSPSEPEVQGRAGADPARPLLALRGAGLTADLVPPRIVEEVSRWLARGGGPLWLRGPSGSGRTTAAGAGVRAGLEREPALLRGALRIESSPGLRLEEALFEINEFLRQLGIGDLDTVLNQRTSLASKMSILLDVLARHPILLWLDDFEHLSASGGSDPGRGFKLFARGCAGQNGAGRLLLVSEVDGPDGLKPEEAGIEVLDMDGAAAGTSLPLAARLRSASIGAVDAARREDLAARLREADTPALVAEVRGLLSDESRRLLEVAAAFRAPLSRGALRALATPTHGGDGEEAARSLFRWGLASEAQEGGWALCLHPEVRRAVEEEATRADPQGWRRLQRQVAVYLLEAGNRTGDLSYFLRSRDQLFSSGHYSEAYEVQKVFLEEILRRGFYELSRKLLEESAATTTGAPRAVSLGNLAIIHKNEGDLDEAARIYEQVRLEFEAVGDQPNVARVHHQLGNTHYLRGDHEQAIDNYQKSLAISLEINERAVAAATRVQIANVQYVKGNHLEALESYRETLKLAEELKDVNLMSAIHLQIGQLLLTLRRLSEAEEELHLAEREAGELGDRRNLIKAAQLLGVVAGERRDYEHAVLHLERAAETASSLGDPLEMAACFLRMGMLEAERVQFSKAAASYLRALDLLEAMEERVHTPGGPSDLRAYRETVEDRLQSLARQVGPEVFARILRGLQRDYPYPGDAPPRATSKPA